MSKRKVSGQDENQVVDVVEVKGSNIVQSPSFFDENQKLISYIGMALAGLAIIYFGYQYLYQGPREKNAINAMYKAENLFEQDSFATALESKSGAYEGFLSIIDNYGGTKAANLSSYYAGISYLNLGKFDDAITYLEDYSAKDDVTCIMKAGALGDAYAEKGDKAKALTYYKDAAKSDNDLLTPYYLHKLALMSYVEGKKDEAVKQLEEIQKRFPDSPENREAEKLIARFQ